MSIPMMSATSGSSARRCTTSAPHQRATPVTRTRLLFEGTTPPVYEAGPSVQLGRSCSSASVSSLDDVAFHVGEPEVEGPDEPCGLRDRRCRIATRSARLPVPAPLPVLGGQHDHHAAQLFRREPLEPTEPDSFRHQDRVLAVHAGCEQALVGGLVLLEEAGLVKDPRQTPQLARVLIHLAGDLALAFVQLLLQGADLAVFLQELAESWRADHLKLALALEQALGLDLESLRHPARVARRPVPAPPAPPSLGAGLAAQALELDPDRAPAVLDLEVLRDVLDRDLRVVPHSFAVRELLADVGEPLPGVGRGQPLLKLSERALHQLLGLLGRVDPKQVERHVVARKELGLDDERRAHRDLIDRSDLDVGLFEDGAVADYVDAAAPRPPHQLRQLASGQGREVDAVELCE